MAKYEIKDGVPVLVHRTQPPERGAPVQVLHVKTTRRKPKRPPAPVAQPETEGE